MTEKETKLIELANKKVAELEEQVGKLTTVKELEDLEDQVVEALDEIDEEKGSEDYENALSTISESLIELQLEIKEAIEDLEDKKSPKVAVVNSDWFKKQAKKGSGVPVYVTEDYVDEDEDDKENLKGKVIAYTVGGIALIGLIGTLVAVGVKAHKKALAEQEAEALRASLATQTIEQVEETTEVEQIDEEKIDKEAAYLELAASIKDEFNKFDGINVSDEQTLALLIHLNVGNSYMTGNEMALDKITRETLIKKYFVGLSEDSEEFKTYIITDDDLAKVTNFTQELRNELVNRVIVLNDQGKYDESKAIIETLELFIIDATLQDEAQALTNNVMSMQSGNIEDIKKGAYRWYNYIFAGPKTDVRNFDDYGYLTDGDNKEMTFENQEMIIRFYTWFLDTFVDIQISGKNIIPQDIINSKEVKLMDQANLMRALGYKNCTAWSYSTVDFDNPLEKQGNRKSTGNTSRTKGSKSNNSNISHATGDKKLDEEIDTLLEQNNEVGTKFNLDDGSTMTVIESGERETTVVIQPDPSSSTVTETTPSGPSERTEVIEGGGNETIEEIHFDEDPTEYVIEEGGKTISSQPSETIEEITFTEDSNETASIKDQINFLKSLKSDLKKMYPTLDITFEDNFSKKLSC